MRRLKISLDLQACQCVSRYRGIGRYSLAFAQALVAAAPHHDVHVMLNGMFPESVDDLTHVFSTLLDRERILTWTGEGPTAECDPANRGRRERAERSREEFLAAHSPDVVHVSSLFEGFPDNAVTSIGECPGGPSTAVTIYDLIPLVHRQHYLGNDPTTPISQYYFRKLSYVRRAALALAISEATRTEAIDIWASIRTPSSTSRPPRTRCSARMRLAISISPAPSDAWELHGRSSCTHGWSRSPEEHRRSGEGMGAASSSGSPISPACRGMPASDGHQSAMRALAAQCGMGSDELLLPGFVPDEDLVGLYNLAKLFIFPSWHEGFGLPVLEAMACGTAVLAANTSSLPEVVGRADALFDPMDASAIAAALQRVLTDDSLRANLRAHGLQRARLFSWTSTARRALDAFEARAARVTRSRSPRHEAPRRRALGRAHRQLCGHRRSAGADAFSSGRRCGALPSRRGTDTRDHGSARCDRNPQHHRAALRAASRQAQRRHGAP